ncbi:MAG: accessory factor UbiK family protein [Thiolinea sp.]
MSNPLEEMIKKFAEAVPEPLRNAQQDMESNVRGILESGLQKMNLVTREEFEIQTAVLQRTREKLEALEKRVAALEGADVVQDTQEHLSLDDPAAEDKQ